MNKSYRVHGSISPKKSNHITSGFEIVPAVLDRHEIAIVAGALQQEGLERSRADARHLMRYPIVQPELARALSASRGRVRHGDPAVS